ncbi:Cytochrome P450 [Penicillium italicum]|uniref:Cytochrome P450 n=1 Tax=Penicillium italicum TaxID=40296 RepID=A0A0A2L1F0_PENIT|nr:Cytochrome P450 [Penicillium italicum]
MILVLVLFTALLTAFLNRASREGTLQNRVLSYVINKFLQLGYPIRSTDGGTTIPTCPYVYPNGQGNVGKFLNGEILGQKWRTEYGPIYRIWSGFTPEIVVSRPEDIQAVFRDSNMHLKGVNMNSGWLVGELLGKCLGLLNQNDWTRAKAAVIEPFHQQTAPNYIQLTEARVKRYIQRIENEKGQGGSMILEPAENLMFLPFWILGDILYGGLDELMERQLDELQKLRHELWKDSIAGGLARYSIGRFIPGARLRNLIRFKALWKDFNDQAYERAKALALPDAPPIVKMYGEIETGQISKLEFLHTMDEILFANLDVTIGNLSWNPVFLAAYPSVQKEIRQEIRQLREDQDDDEWKAYLSGTNTMLMASILETARLKPMASFSIPQAAPTQRVVGDYVIPAGTQFVVDTHGLNIGDANWGADRGEYHPRRFLGQNAVTWRYRFWRYGFGPRQCLGKHVADIMLKTIVAYLIENFQLAPLGKEGHDLGDWQKKPEIWISLAIQPIMPTKLKAQPGPNPQVGWGFGPGLGPTDGLWA